MFGADCGDAVDSRLAGIITKTAASKIRNDVLINDKDFMRWFSTLLQIDLFELYSFRAVRQAGRKLRRCLGPAACG